MQMTVPCCDRKQCSPAVVPHIRCECRSRVGVTLRRRLKQRPFNTALHRENTTVAPFLLLSTPEMIGSSGLLAL